MLIETMIVYVVDDNAQKQSQPGAKEFFELVDRAIADTSEATRVAFDCEGVNLSRIGTIELVSLVFDKKDETASRGTSTVFLIDIGGGRSSVYAQERINALKRLFECGTVPKIIHDSRMDSDALFHLHGIVLNNVHDTSCFHPTEETNVNDVLIYNGLEPNGHRDTSVYKQNPRFWASRPLTQKMKSWASSDVGNLIPLADKQISSLGDTRAIENAKAKSASYATLVKDMKLETGLRVSCPIGLFIGSGGSNIRSLRARTNTLIYQDDIKNTWFVYYDPTKSNLAAVKRAMNN